VWAIAHVALSVGGGGREEIVLRHARWAFRFRAPGRRRRACGGIEICSSERWDWRTMPLGRLGIIQSGPDSWTAEIPYGMACSSRMCIAAYSLTRLRQ
jgi:hypothetical protein